jgi:hypothetical protein
MIFTRGGHTFLKISLSNSVRTITAAILLGCVPGAMYAAETHVVTLDELHQRSVEATQQRQRDIEELNQFFSSETVAKALHTGKLDGTRLRQAVPLLNNEELSRLAVKARQVQSNFAAGALSNQDLTYVVIALATAVLILVIVAAH